MVRVRGSAVARHLHPQLAAVQHRPVHGVHGVLGVALVVEADEGEAAGLLGVAVPRDVHIADAPVLLEHAPQGVGRGAVGQVVHLEGGHALHIGRRATVTHGPGEPAGGRDCAPKTNALGGPARSAEAAVSSHSPGSTPRRASGSWLPRGNAGRGRTGLGGNARKQPTPPKKQLGGQAALAPVYIPPHKMAPAPPGNESPDWLAPTRPATPRPRAPPLPDAPAQSPAGGPKSAESLLLGGGSGIFGQLESPRKALSGCEAVRAFSRKRNRKRSPSRPRLLFMPISEPHAAFPLGPQQEVPASIRASTSPPPPVCPAVSGLLRPRYHVSGFPPAVPDFSAGFRFEAPPWWGGWGAGSTPLPSRRACASRAVQDYISQPAQRPAAAAVR